MGATAVVKPARSARLLRVDQGAWGGIHIVLGVMIAIAGFYLFQGAVWARTVGIVLAALSAVLNFAWLPYYPVWSILIIAFERRGDLGAHRARP